MEDQPTNIGMITVASNHHTCPSMQLQQAEDTMGKYSVAQAAPRKGEKEDDWAK